MVNFEALSHFIENQKIDECIRGSVLYSLVVFVQEGIIDTR